MSSNSYAPYETFNDGGVVASRMSSMSRSAATPSAQHLNQSGYAIAAQTAPQILLTDKGYGYYALAPNGATVFVPTAPPTHHVQHPQQPTSMLSSSVHNPVPAQHYHYVAAPPASAILPATAAPLTSSTMTNNVLAQLEREFRDIEERDPSLADGFRVVYDREVPFELRPADSRDHDVGALEGIKVKILAQGESEASVSAVRIELTSEADLFFHYTCLINAVGFTQLREDQKLMCEFKDFVVTLLKMCNRCIREPNSFLAVLLLNTDGSASLEFIQNVEYKFIDLLVLPFRESPDHVVRADISYRYNAVRSRLSIMTSKLQDVTALVKVRQ